MVPTLAVAQVERYELGRRLRLFEAAWEKWDCHEARQRALPLLRPLTGQFFSFRFAEAGRTLDRATFALQAADGPPAGRRWAAALQIVPQSRLLDETTTELIVTVQPFYQPDVPLPPNARLRLWFTNQSTVSVTVQTWPVTVRVPLPPLNDHTGLDRRLYVLLDVRGNLEPASVGISQVRHLRARLERLKAACDKLPRHCELEAATIRTRLQAWQAALQGETPITDFPYALWLDNAELMAAGRPFFTPERQGQFWITLPTGSAGSVPCRLFVPKGLQKHQPVPLVVALHGAGVDENMFFDSYGAGQIVRECQQRGWMLLSPRAGLLGPPPVPQLIDTLAQRYPIDRKRVFLVGHSMGAAHAMAVALRQPDAYTAVAALGGAPRIAQVQALQRLPFFLAVGTHDSLAINGARKLHQQLTTAQLPHYHYREYPELEHLLIVRQALPDVFAFFDKFVKPTP
ncbi:MAG: alpha/beta hydrolase-fold protein [Gemmataceae bacterium]|nr:alpha/beta hydrolase-fold protein [Gemmataceae bacterium]